MNTDLILIENFIKDHPASAARILEDLQINDIVRFIEEISVDLAFELIIHLEQYTVIRCLEILNIQRAADIIERLPLELSAAYIRQLKSERSDHLLSSIKDEFSSPLRRILSYPENTAGALVEPIVLTFPEDIEAEDALARIKKHSLKATHYLYILRRDHTLAGVINIRDLMQANPQDKLSMLMQVNVERLSAEANVQTILGHPGWMSYHTLPVVDTSGIFLGTIGHATLRRIETGSRRRGVSRQAITAGNALGELYRIGLSGLIRGAAEGYQGRKEK